MSQMTQWLRQTAGSVLTSGSWSSKTLIGPTVRRYAEWYHVPVGREGGDLGGVGLCVKVKLEEKQRARRRKREAAATRAVEAAEAGNTAEAERLKKESTINPMWFSKEFDQLTGAMMHVYKGGYWAAKAKQDWSGVPQIF